MRQSEVIDAILSLVSVVKNHRQQPPQPDARRLEVVSRIRTTGHRIRELSRSSFHRRLRETRELLLPRFDPLRIPVDIFGGFGVQSKEIRYTQFLASVLDGNQGARSQIVAWTALCELVAQKYRQRQDGHLAKLWSHAKSCLPESVRPEVTIPPPKAHSSAGGKRDARPDILILTEDLHILVELKLGGDWNESKTSHQALKYETYLNNMDLHGRTRSLVSIARQRLERKEGSSFLNLTWCEYSTELRRCLRTKSNGIGAHSELPDELGVLLLLGGIERHQVGLQIPKCLRALLAADPQVSEDSAPVPEWFQVHSQLSHLHHYLKTST